MIHYAQWDIDYTFSQMIDLCIAPRRVFRLTSYRKATKNQWARDDPAFVVVLGFFLAVASICYSMAFRVPGFTFLRILFIFIVLHFVVSGLLIASSAWFFCNRYLRKQSVHGVEQKMEWMFAFDVHCNSFFPLFLILYVLHYFLLPYLIQETAWAVIVSNLMYATALFCYLYITSLGYATLPFLERAEIFLYPSVLLVVALVALSTAGVNLTRVSLYVLGV